MRRYRIRHEVKKIDGLAMWDVIVTDDIDMVDLEHFPSRNYLAAHNAARKFMIEMMQQDNQSRW